MKKTYQSRKSAPPGCLGFSLLELMITITIIGILSALAMPGIQMAMLRAKMTQATNNVRQIGHGLRIYAGDNDGLFPSGSSDSANEVDNSDVATTSNAVFRELLPDYIDSESIFAVGRSAWGRQSDGRIDSLEDRLGAGENHYAYVAGLFDTSISDWPLVVDGTDGSGGYHTTVGQKGGCWGGRKGIVYRVGGSAEAVKLAGSGDERYLPRVGYPEENALDVSAYMGDHVQLLDPE